MPQEGDALLGELRAIKLLMMLQLLRQGVKRSEIAGMLGISERTLGRMLAKSTVRPSAGAQAEKEG